MLMEESYEKMESSDLWDGTGKTILSLKGKWHILVEDTKISSTKVIIITHKDYHQCICTKIVC